MPTLNQIVKVELESQGFEAEVTERRHHRARRLVDLLGFIDVIGVHPVHGPVAVQITTDTNRSHRVRKMAALPTAQAWVASGTPLLLWLFASEDPSSRQRVFKVTTLNPATVRELPARSLTA